MIWRFRLASVFLPFLFFPSFYESVFFFWRSAWSLGQRLALCWISLGLRFIVAFRPFIIYLFGRWCRMRMRGTTRTGVSTVLD
jgi:hypothetical protein